MVKVEGTTITLPKGDTGIVRFDVEVLNSGGASVIVEDRDVCLFSIVRDGEDIESTLTELPIVDGAAVMAFTNDLTDDLESGNYNYNVRVIINPVRDGGKIVDGDEVHTPLSIETNGRLPKLKLLEVGVNV